MDRASRAVQVAGRMNNAGYLEYQATQEQVLIIIEGVVVRIVQVWIIVFSVGLALAGCAGTSQLVPVTDSGQRIEFPEFSILPPQGQHWFVAPASLRRQQGLIASFVRVPTPRSKTHTVIAGVRGQRGVYKEGSRAELLQKLARLHAERNERNQPVSVAIAPDTTLGPDCVRFDVTVEDRGVPGYPGAVFVADTHGFICLHPNLPDAAIEILYTQRRLQKEQPLSLAADGEPFLTSLRFK